MISPALLTIFFASAIATDKLKVAFQWNRIGFEYPHEFDELDAKSNRDFIPEVNVPLGIEVYKDRLFLTLPRWDVGVPASLAYINLSDRMDKPKLRPYPDWESHKFAPGRTPRIVSPFRIRADSCGRLWVLDSGLDKLLTETVEVSKPQLLIYNLTDDQLLSNYTIPENQISAESLFANIVVEEKNCDDSFAYLADSDHPALVVFSLKENRSWLVKHHFFNIEPLAGNMNLSGVILQWSHGLYGIALSNKDQDGFSTLYFHPMTSFREFTVSTRVLQDENLATNSTANFHLFKYLGTRGNRSESGVSFLHKNTDVLFYSLLNLNAVVCWRTTNPNYTMHSTGLVFKNDSVVFPSDLKVDSNDVLWVLFNSFPKFQHNMLDYREYNFWILNATVSDAIKGTPCDSKMVVDPEILTKLNNTLSIQRTKESTSGTRAITAGFGVIFICLFVIFNK